MAKVRTEHKTALLDMGKWADFVLYRDDLKMKGVSNAKANQVAVGHFLGSEAAKSAGESLPVAGRKTKTEGSGSRTAKRIDPKAGCILPPERGEAVTSLSASPLDKSAVPAPPSPLVAIEATAAEVKALEGRSAGEIEIIRWVARSMGVAEAGGKVDISTCPDPAAWFYFANCLRSPGFAQEFCRTMYSKIIPRGKDDGSKDGEEFDGAVTVELLGRIRSLRGGAAVAQVAHNDTVMGSSPIPASNAEASA